MQRRRWIVILIAIAALLSRLIGTSQCESRGAEGTTGASPGVSLTFESLDGKITDARESRLIALCVPEKTFPTPYLNPGPFRATWRGAITLKLRAEYTFTAHGRGEFEL